jgi:hypothetical protein
MTARPSFARGAIRVVGGATLLVLLPSILAGQTPVTSLGLGYPVPPLDGRAAALGGTGLGLLGGTFASRNPADLNLFERPGIGATLSPEKATVKSTSGDQTIGRSRLAVLQAVLPHRRWRVGLTINAELDQNWQVVLRDTLDTGFGDYPFEESRRHDGGVSSVGLAVARRVGRFGVGLEGTVLTGNLRQVFRRNFDAEIDDPGNTIRNAAGDSRWAFNGWRFRGGVLGEIGGRALVSAAVTFYTPLEARKDTFGIRIETQEWDMPVEISVGGSARVSERLWSATDFTVLRTESSDVVWAGVGLEYVGASLLSMPVPLRAGYRYTDLPFHEEGFQQLSETALTLGAGVRIAGGRALLDFAVEFGSRGDLQNTGSEESFRRLSMSLGIVSR